MSSLGVAGCGGKPADVAEVSGVVTFDQKPLANATVQLQSESDPDIVFIARTDEAGQFKLMYGRGITGAKIGKYKVRVSTFIPANPDADPPIPPTPERIPVRYNGDNTELSAEVTAGENNLKFELSPEGEIVQPTEPEVE